MRKSLLLLILAISTTIAFSQSESSNEIHKRITISNPTQETLKTLLDIGIDLRCGVKITDEQIQLELPPFELNLIESKGISYDVEIEDVSKFYKERIDRTHEKALKDLELEKSRSHTQKASVSSTTLDNFLEYTGCDEIDWTVPTNFNIGASFGGCLTVSQMEDELDDMRTLYPSLISAKADASTTGITTWGNPASNTTNNGITNYTGQGTTRWDPQTIWYVRITGNQANPEGTNPQSLFTSMIHARELGSLMSNIYFMWYLLENYATDPAIQNLVDNNELYFIPVVNPDGLRWNEHLASGGGGLQRKNCRPNTGSTSNSTSTRGVDLNRNFDYFWGTAGSGSSPTPSSDSYRGPSAFSEPEAQIIKEFVESRDLKTCLMNHTSANAIPHPYGGIPTNVSGREDEMHKWHEDMTRYNRYVSGATIFSAANGIADDWMVGGPADGNGETGSLKTVLASTPEHGDTGFWPPETDIIPIAKRAMRLSLTSAYYAGKYAKFHDLTQSDILTISSNLTFGIERLGQTVSDFTLTVTPISANIVSITSPATQVGMTVLEQRDVTATLTLDAGISSNDKIEYRVQLANGDGIVFYDANFEKYYQPTVLFSHDPDTDGLTGWTQSGGWNNSSVDAYSGSDALRTGNTVPYANNNTKTLTTASSYDLSSTPEVLVQFYTKWDLERNFDFVEIEGSTDGSSWQALCGKYNKPSATSSANGSHGGKSGTSHSFQSNNSSGRVYDGDRMDNWVMEEIIIDGSNNSFLAGATTAEFRFRFRSDSGNESENYSTTSDGFFIDDFKVIGIQVGPTPCIGSVVDAFPYAESFENVDLGLWTQSTSDDINWTRNQGGTVSGGTGPDNASDNNNSSYYLYTEASGDGAGFPNKKAYLYKCIDFTGFENAELQFDYHMFGAQMGALSVEVSVNDGASYTSEFSISGEQHAGVDSDWTTAIVDLSAYDGQSIKLRFYGETLDTFRSDMAIDNLNITADTEVLGTSNFDIDEWSIYPNPSSIGLINIQAPNDIQRFEVLISNTLGQQVYQEKAVLSNNRHTINTSNLNTGVYFITLNANEGKSTKKIVIQ